MDGQRVSRIGRILITDKIIEDKQIPYVFYKIGFLPVRVEFLYAQMSFEYIGISDNFDPVPEGAMAPDYQVEMEQDAKGGLINIQVKKVD